MKKSFAVIGLATLLGAGWFFCVPRQEAKAVDPELYLEAETPYCVLPGVPKEAVLVSTYSGWKDFYAITAVAEMDPEETSVEDLYFEEGPVENVQAAVTEPEAPPCSEDDLEMLACVIYQEAGGDEASDEIRRMVGEVVLNRVADPRFPNTIKEVLLQKSQYGRFHWTGIVWPARAAKEPEAVERAYRCAQMVFEEERLLPTDAVFQAEFVQGPIVAQFEGYYFCR